MRAIVERRLKARRFDTPLIFHRVCKGKPGQSITDYWDVWQALRQLRDTRQDGGGKSLTGQRGVGSSGRIRTYDPPVNSRMLYR